MINLVLPTALAALLLLEVAVHALAAYQLGVAAVGLRRPARPSREAISQRLLVLMPAHDEAAVVTGAVRSLLACDYPSEARTLVVLADRCTDRTAELAAAAGADVLERPPTDDPGGKPGAIAWALAQLRPRLPAYDALVLLDADNRVAPELLRRLAGRLEAGEQVVQAFTGLRGALASRTATWSALGFLAINHLGQEPRERLGWSAAVGGTGVAIALPVLEAVPWTMTALTEDLELGARLALAGIRVAFDQVRVYDEKPADASADASQRQRWLQGRFEVIRRMFVPLVERAFLQRDFRAADVALSLLSPGLGFAGVFTGCAALGRLALLTLATALGWPRTAFMAGLIPPGAALAAACAYYASVFLALRTEKAPWPFYRAALTAPGYLLRSLPFALLGVLGRGRRGWTRTPHGGSDP